MTDIIFQLLIELHKNNHRQGPWSKESTIKAFDAIPIDKYQNLKIADIGCGTGAQTIDLAQNSNCEIVAVDLFEEFLSQLKKNAKNLGLESRIKTVNASMDDLPFEKECFDIVWSEWAIYNIGFEKWLQYRKTFLKPKWYIALSEISWITETRPKEIEDHRNAEYPEIDTIQNKIKTLEANGYTLLSHFVLPYSDWLENYYQSLENRFEEFLVKNTSEEAKEIIKNEIQEINLYKKYKEYYSYGFYIAQKNSVF